MIELTDRREDFGFTYVWSNDHAIGQMGAEHLIERGFRDFAFCGFAGEAWSTRREHAFSEAIKKLGYRVHSHFDLIGSQSMRIIGRINSINWWIG